MKTALRLLLASTLTAVPGAAQIVGPTCMGTGCPCANDDASAGCGNAGLDGSTATGASLSGSGTADVLFDDLVLYVEGVRAGASGLVFMGPVSIQTPFGDGFRCVGAGGTGTFRFPVRQADTEGRFRETDLVARSQTFAGGTITPGSTWFFQGWYRDPLGPCGNGFNLTNALEVLFQSRAATAPVELDLAGRPLTGFPHFERIDAFNEAGSVHVAIDPTRVPFAAATTPDLYVVEAKDELEWTADPSLVDARGAAQPVSIGSLDVQSNTFLVDTGTLSGTNGTGVGVGYDVVVDMDGDGQLGAGDLIDGAGDATGLVVVRDLTLPGPHAVSQIFYSGGAMRDQTAYFPTDIATLGQLPVVIVSHGNGHNYQWYDHIGSHLASYGYVVMSHFNNTMPGPDSASLTTLDNTEYFLANQGVIEGGVLDGHLDSDRMVWFGHSRGGEGVVRAYDRLIDGDATPTQFDASSLLLISSIAPTNFLGTGSATPHGAPFHLWTGSADADVNGGPASDVTQTFQLLERGSGYRIATTAHGVGHGAFHDGGGSWVADGPCRVGRVRTHTMMRGVIVPLLAWFVRDEDSASEHFWRQFEAFQPIGGPGNADGCIAIQRELVEPEGPAKYVLDDFQTEMGTDVASSGGMVSFDVELLTEGLLDDANGSFAYTLADPMNGMTRASEFDKARGVVFEWDEPAFFQVSVPSEGRDFTERDLLSFRACQRTRHPLTATDLGDLSFSVTLVDEFGAESSVSIGVFGGGVEEPYQRLGGGSEPGWANEFETTRIRLADFVTNGSPLDLTRIAAVRFDFGGPNDSAVGAIGLDDIELLGN